MDNRVASNNSRIPASNIVSLPAPRLPLGSNGPVTLNTTDAASFSARPGTDLDSVESKIRELDQRISALESQVGQMNQNDGGMANNAGPRTAAANNYTPAYNNNAAANQAQANNPVGNYGATNNAAYNNAPAANNGAAANSYNAANNITTASNQQGALINLNANNGAANGLPPVYQVPPPPAAVPPVPPPPPTPPALPPAPPLNGASAIVPADAQAAQMRQELTDLHQKLDRAISNVDRLAAIQAAQLQAPRPVPSQVDITTSNAAPVPALTNTEDDLARQQAGMAAVQNVLNQVKPGKYPPDQQATINGAVKRVKQIGQEIAGGEDPAQYSAELFALKATIADPAGVGNHRTATSGAQVIQLAEDAKAKIATQLDQLAAKEARGPLSQRDAAKKADLVARYGSLIKVEKALDTAKVTQLTPQGDQVAADAINRLGAITEGLAAGKMDPQAVDQEVYRLGQVLRDPNTPPRREAVQAGAQVLQKIEENAQSLKDGLSQIDDQIAGGAAPEQYAADRADLMNRLEALNELANVVQGAKADQRDQAGRRDIALGLQQAAQIADAIGQGDGPAAHRAQVFVLKQTFQEPRASRDNPAIQSAAATLQLFGRAEARIQQQRDAMEDKINQGADPRQFDQQATALNRRAEDLESMRHAIEGANFGGLTPEQEAHGAEIVDQMRGLALRVAQGEDFNAVKRPYQQLAKQLGTLNKWQGPAVAPQPQPIVVQPRPTRPILRPLPTTADNDGGDASTVGNDGPVATKPTAPAPKPVAPKPVAPTPVVAPKPAETNTKTVEYHVKQDDYLTKIAREQLGDANRWQEIVDLNKDKYPSLAQNPDLIYEGWTLKLPAGGGAAKPEPKPTKPVAVKPQPKPVTPKPPVAVDPAPTAPTKPTEPTKPANQSDRDAVQWLSQNVDDQGLTRADVERWMPDGPGKQATLKYFDSLMFGYIDPGAEGWNRLFPGDIARMKDAVDHDHTIKELADSLTEAVLTRRDVADLNHDGKVDDADLKAYVAQLRGTVNQPTQPTPKPQDGQARLQRELQAYLDTPNNQNDSAALSLINDHPQYAEAATPEQKARLIGLVLDGHANKGDKAGAMKVLQAAAQRKELDDVLNAVNARNGAMKDLMSKMDNPDFAKLLLADGNAYREPAVYSAMDDDASATLCRALGFKHPMVGQSDALLELPEEAKYKMIKELTSGNVSWTELYMAQWINTHCEIPYRIPEYLTSNNNGQ